MCVLDSYDASLDADDAIRGIAELEDIAREAFDREVFVDGAHQMSFRLEHHLIVRGIGNRAARRDCGQTSALAAADLAVYRIVIDERAASPAPRRKPFGEHAHGLIECFPRERKG